MLTFMNSKLTKMTGKDKQNKTLMTNNTHCYGKCNKIGNYAYFLAVTYNF